MFLIYVSHLRFNALHCSWQYLKHKMHTLMPSEKSWDDKNIIFWLWERLVVWDIPKLSMRYTGTIMEVKEVLWPQDFSDVTCRYLRFQYIFKRPFYDKVDLVFGRGNNLDNFRYHLFSKAPLLGFKCQNVTRSYNKIQDLLIIYTNVVSFPFFIPEHAWGRV